MQRFEHLITTRPHAVRRLLISDLHLSPDEPALVQAFLGLLDDCLALPNLSQLFILGDWFEVWIGDDAYLRLNDDDKAAHWLTPMIKRLKQLRVGGCEIFVMHGNRDFLLGQPFCNLFGGALIDEPYHLSVGDKTYRLEHGDALCTDDKKYQFFRRVMRNPITKWYLLNKSLDKRLKIADNMRQKSQADNQKKSAQIMDVNEIAVNHAIYTLDGLIHGHTHRPECHRSSEGRVRFVLGDWRVINNHSRQPSVSAVIGAVIDDDARGNGAAFRLVEFDHKSSGVTPSRP